MSQISYTQSLRKCDTLLSRVQNLIIIIFIAAPAIYYWKIMVSEIQATGGKKVTAWELAKKGFSY